MTLLASIVALGLADALNPFTIAMQAYLLGTPRPLPRSIVFLVGTFLTYLVAGFALLQGLAAMAASLLPLLPAWIVPAGKAVLGLACLGFALYSWLGTAGEQAFKAPKDLGLAATAVLAAVSTASDLPTALPYLAALGQIARTTDAAAAQLGWLLLYNLIYVLPLAALVGVAVIWGERSAALFGRIQAAVDWGFRWLLPPLLALVGAWLVVDGAIDLSGVLA